jgi:hypothetical protein
LKNIRLPGVESLKVKRSLDNRMRGWFPQEPNCKNATPTLEKHRLINKKVLISLSVLALCLLTASVFVVPLILSNGEGDGWVYSKQIEQVSFPGGNIVVYENRQSPQDRGYLTVTVEANVTSQENLAAYVESRTNALNALLATVTANSTIEAVITFKDPISPEDFASLVETSVEKLGEYATILTDETTNIKSTEVLWFPRPQEADFIQNLTSIKEGYKLEGIIAFECYIKAESAKSLQSDPKVLLIDPLEDLQLLEVKKDYMSKGFDVQFDRPFFKEMWNQYALMKQ